MVWAGPALAQTCATTENGRQVVLSKDRSWEYARGDDCKSASSADSDPKTTEVLIGSERYPAGVRKTIIDEDFLTLRLKS
jgi:hypothetical protein